MAKKDLASLMNGIMGEPDPKTRLDRENSVSGMQDTQSNIRKVGRPRKDNKNNEVRATLIVDQEHLQKMKYISLVDGCLLKDIIGSALTDYIEKWEELNGNIRLPKSRK